MRKKERFVLGKRTFRSQKSKHFVLRIIYPDYDTVDSTGISHEDLPIIMEQNRIELNKLLAPYEAVSALQLYPTEFEKTPKKSIKRYLYSNY